MTAGDDAEGEDDVGDGVGDCAGDWVGDGVVDCVEDDVGLAVGVTVEVTHGSGPAIRLGAPPVPSVRAVVATTPAAIHIPVAMLVTAVRRFKAITRLIPILQSSV